jgi:hypothetical protein
MLESISPELALVDPELAEAARAALPERPWEAFLPPPRPEPVRAPEPKPVHEIALPAVLELPVEQPPLRQEPATVAATAPAVPLPAPARRRRRIPITPLVVLGLGIVVTVAGYLPASDAPVLIEPKPPAKPETKPTLGRPAPGTYVDGPIVRLVLARDGTLTGTAASLACDAAGPVAGAVRRDGSFRGTVAALSDGRRVTGSILGRSAGAELQGVVRLRSSGCDSGPVLFAAKRQPTRSR